MSNQPLKEKLQRLQCHFTWNLEVKHNFQHTLKKLDLHLEHTFYHNRGTYLAMKAYLHHLRGDYHEALGSLQRAEEVLKQDHPTNFSCQALVIYGNYAWIYYHLTNYEEVELYLGRIREICQALASPEPYSVEIPGVQAQKGWSLLASGFRNGPEATECFRMALRKDESNKEYKAGLAFSIFASWTHSPRHLQHEAQGLLEEVCHHQPQNYEAKVYLSRVLERTDQEQSNRLVEEVIENSLNPEVLRNASKVYRPQSLPQAIDILKKAIALDPNYHLLHYDLGVYYMELMERGSPGDREETIALAIESFKRSLETDPESVFSQLKLAKMYGERSLEVYEEEIHQNLLEDMLKLSKRCQQALYLHRGDFLLHRKGERQGALEMYQACYQVHGDHPLERSQLVESLKVLARRFRENMEMDHAEVVYSLLRRLGFEDRRDERGAARREQ
ncbi:interferon-induced protein with tetratricopeptide repeats 5-like isoform X2 [Sceloporus undulatus]|uniref:interferon-induced protein with tetratricopeptide repeats 5-like isoform X1 n=1 Tax=Sceloporus undulatus TaxID=8520 RepID=UPI001C4B3E9A|nr:interferon-induced protein with tetratricopeptide repeats 5-like isoform X1 [Sceloporus undulatus]XP_042324917.1 interferon-induced protein with tetratricopeptide repeats 5-like isoform X2 [Sceloporus undulatus]